MSAVIIEVTASAVWPTDRARKLPCQHHGPRLWFSDRPSELNQAKALCRGCPHRSPCLAGAVARAEPYGVWGGEIFEDGVVIRNKRPRGRPRKYPKTEEGERLCTLKPSCAIVPSG
jgi:WhiB family transcriptional regulator, redox-sensing transcriptional regulator